MPDRNPTYVVCALYTVQYCGHSEDQAFQYPISDEFLEVHTDLIHPGPSHYYTYSMSPRVIL